MDLIVSQPSRNTVQKLHMFSKSLGVVRKSYVLLSSVVFRLLRDGKYSYNNNSVDDTSLHLLLV